MKNVIRSVGVCLFLLAAWIVLVASTLLVYKAIFPPSTRRPLSPDVKVNVYPPAHSASGIAPLLPPLPGADRLR